MHTYRHKKRPIISFVDAPSLTEQSHAAQCKIQNIMRKFEKTGVLDHVSEYKGTYMDMPDAPSFQDAQNQIALAKTMFETVPAKIREEFDHDPAQFLEFMQNPENVDAIEEYGLDSSHLDSEAVEAYRAGQVDVEALIARNEQLEAAQASSSQGAPSPDSE